MQKRRMKTIWSILHSSFSILNYCKQKENRFRGSLSLSKKAAFNSFGFVRQHA